MFMDRVDRIRHVLYIMFDLQKAEIPIFFTEAHFTNLRLVV